MNFAEFQEFLGRTVLFKHDAVKSGVYKPTLVVSLGGVGSRILRQLKRHLQSSAGSAVKLLAIDTDTSENEKFPHLPPLNQNELVLLNPQVALDDLRRAAAGQPDYAHILDFLPDKQGKFNDMHGYVRARIGGGMGAGQFRRAGKLLFTTNVSSGARLKSRLESVKQELAGLSAKLQKQYEGMTVLPGVNIYVVCSIAGGTGAGCLIDALALLRLIFSGDDDQIITFGLLPGMALDRLLRHKNEPVNTRANAIGVLSEIQAVKTGAVELPMKFTFDNRTSSTIKMGANFPNSFYLIDNQFYRGTAVDSFMDLCEAVGTFIYFLVGTGMGADQDSSRVNNGVTDPDKMLAGEIPPIFSTLGLGYLEFPIQDLSTFAFMRGLNEWLGDWMASLDPMAGRNASQLLISKLTIKDLREIAANIGISSEFIPELSGFTQTDRQRLTKVTCFDKRFFEIVSRKMESFIEDVPSYRKKIEARAAKQLDIALKNLESGFNAIYTENLGAAKECLAELKAHLKKLTDELAREAGRCKSELKELENTKDTLADAINRKDLLSDKAERNLYLNAITKEMELKLFTECLPQRIKFVEELESWVAERVKQLDKLDADLDGARKGIARSMEERAQQHYQPSIGAYTLPPAKFEDWCRKNEIKLPTRIDLDTTNISAESVCYSVWQAISSLIHDRAKMVNLTTQVADDTDEGEALRRKVKGLSLAGTPMINLNVDLAPGIADMSPETFIAGWFPGKEDANREFVKKHFNALGGLIGERPSVIHTGNPHLLVCSQVLSGFGAAHWVGFPEAESYYRSMPDKPWYCGTFPASIKVPSLLKRSSDNKDNLVNFGLGLALELVDFRGANCYLNFEAIADAKEDSETKYRYASFRQERNPIAAAILEYGFIEESRPTKGRPDKLLGASLAAAMDNLQKKLLDEGLAMRELFENLEQRFKKGVAKDMLLNWVDTELKRMIDAAASDRRELLRAIDDELAEYAKKLR